MLVLRCGPVSQQRVTLRREKDLAPEAAVLTRLAEQAARAGKIVTAATMKRVPTDTGIVSLLPVIRKATAQLGLLTSRIIHHPIIRRTIHQTIHPIHPRIILQTTLRTVRPTTRQTILQIRRRTSQTAGKIARLRPMSATG